MISTKNQVHDLPGQDGNQYTTTKFSGAEPLYNYARFQLQSVGRGKVQPDYSGTTISTDQYINHGTNGKA